MHCAGIPIGQASLVARLLYCRRRRSGSSRVPGAGARRIYEGPGRICAQNVTARLRTNHAGAGAPEHGPALGGSCGVPIIALSRLYVRCKL